MEKNYLLTCLVLYLFFYLKKIYYVNYYINYILYKYIHFILEHIYYTFIDIRIY